MKVLGISSGLGVSLWPFKDYLIGNIEIRAIFHTKCNSQWKANFNKTSLWKKIPKKENLKPDVIISSPDCGSGSVLRYSRAKKLGNHKENQSLKLFFKGLKMYKPKYFLFENLDGLFKSFPKDEFEQKCKHYRLIIHNCSVSNFGNSQKTRKRLIIIGIRKDLKNQSKFFKEIKPLYELRTCKELYGDLKEVENIDLGHVREPLIESFALYGGKKITGIEAQSEWANRLKGKKRWIVENGNFSTAPGVYRNLKNDFPATARKANRQFDHLGLTLSPRQLARVQGVPDEFKIIIKNINKKYWINKGRALVTKTPPMEISYWFLKILKQSNPSLFLPTPLKDNN